MQFQSHYTNWIQSRMNCIRKYIPVNYFQSKTILELGGGHGHIGNEFFKMNAHVTTSDAREEHIAVAKSTYPHLNTILIDGDNIQIPEKYDIIVHWGLLYHLKEIEHHIQYIAEKCNVLLLETEVSDSENDSFFIKTNECGYDQAFNSIGIRPSPSYVEKILSKNGFQYVCILDSILNSDFHTYDWKIENTHTWRHGLRRFWICWKDVESPMQT